MISRQILLVAFVGMSFNLVHAMILVDGVAKLDQVQSSLVEKKLRAHDALSQEASQAFAQVVVGCCELEEDVVPLALFRAVLEKHPGLKHEVNPITFLSYSGVPFGNYFESRLSDSQTQLRTTQLLAEWKKISLQALADFVDQGNAADFIGVHGHDTIKAIQAFQSVFASQKIVGEYCNAQGTTVLAKFAACGEQALEVMKYLLEECDANPDAGSLGHTPRDIAVELGHTVVVDLFDQATYKRRLRGWMNSGDDAMPLVQFFSERPESRVEVDTLIFRGSRTCEAVLWDINAECSLQLAGAFGEDQKIAQAGESVVRKQREAQLILAHAAPHMRRTDKRIALTSVIVGCCEFLEDLVPLKLITRVVENILKTKPHMRMGDESGIFKAYAGAALSDYLAAKLADPMTQARAEQVCAELKKFYHVHPESNLPRPRALWVTHPADSNETVIALLIRDCIIDDARIDELKDYLTSLDSQFFTIPEFPAIEYVKEERRTLVTNLIIKHNEVYVPCRLFEKLLSVLNADLKTQEDAVRAFISYISEHRLDIDAIRWRDSFCIGAVDISNFPASIESAFQAIERYRSEPSEGDDLYKHIKRVLSGTEDVQVLKDFLRGRRFNIDLVCAPNGYGQIVTIASLLEKDSQRDAILDLPEIKNFRSGSMGE